MLGQRLQTLFKTVFIAGALFVTPTIIRAADVSDDAGFFSAAAIEKANTAIKEIEKKSGHDIRIETHATVPKDQIGAVSKMDRSEREKYMDRWVHERAKAVKETGSLILICKEPPRVERWFSGRLANSGMTKDDQKQITDALIDGMKSKDYDAALSATVTKLGEVYSKLAPASKLRSDSGHREPLPATASTPPHQGGPIHQGGAVHQVMPVRQASSMGWIYIVGIVIAAIVAIRLLSGLFASRNNGYPQGAGQPGMGGGYPPGGYPPQGAGYGPAGYGGGGGGGFMRSMAGGLFGAVAGNWLYNSFGGHSAHAGQTSDGSDPLSGSRTLGGGGHPSDNGGWTDDGSSSGGGWYDSGDSGGGGDFGDSGGGDFGGGDSGGDSGGGDF